jgi:hypothetical protein
MGIWPSPKSVAIWLQKNWVPFIKGSPSHFFCGRGYYTSLFNHKEDKDLFFRRSPYFLGERGMNMYKWTSNFNLENDVPSVVPSWVRLPHLPLHCWSDDALHCISNSLGCYIDGEEPKENMFSCARICNEVN